MAECFPRRLRALRSAMTMAALLAAGCAPPAPPPLPAVPPIDRISDADLETIARLLQAEDRRDFAEPLLREAAASPEARVRRQGALAIGRLRRPEGAALLIGLLNDADSSVAATAAFSLGLIGDTSHVAALAPLLSRAVASRRPTVAAEAAFALGRMGGAASGAALLDLLARATESPAAPVEAALLAIWRFPGPPGLDTIVRWTGSADPELRWRAAYALSRRPTARAVPALLPLVSDEDPRVRAFALRGLTGPLADSSDLGAAAVLPTVVAALGDDAYTVRMSAIRSLGSYSGAAAVEPLAALLAGADGHSALAAAEALARLGPDAAGAAPALRRVALSDSAPVAIRAEAATALARVAPALASPVAGDLATSPEWRLRAAAARSLAVASGPGSPELVSLLRDPDGRVAAAGLQAVLEEAGNSVAPLRDRLLEAMGSADTQVRATALAGLARLGGPSALPLLLDAYQVALSDSVADAALAAIDALAAVEGRGAAPHRAFFARFPRSTDYLVRLRARERFGASADSAWGNPLPIRTGRTLAEYRAIATSWLAPRQASADDSQVEIETAAGIFRVRLFAAAAPLATESFLALAGSGFFDGQEWPRVVPNFVVQGGDPRGDTSGGPGYSVRDEINRHRYRTGSVGMALSGPDTGGSQFFVTHSPQPHLDGDYTVFGEVVEGQETTEAILPGEWIRTIRIVK